jgi:threonine/homoserine/homoserine lactone efflux protein
VDLNAFILLVIACLAVNLSPGPSVLLVTSVSAARGFKAGLFAVLGMTAGAFVHVMLAASGVAAALAAAPVVFSLVQYLGAAYLIVQSATDVDAKPGVPGRRQRLAVFSPWAAGGCVKSQDRAVFPRLYPAVSQCR